VETQTLTQTINIIIGDGLANTGASIWPLITAALVLITSGVLAWRFGFRRSAHSFKLRAPRKLTSRGLSIFILLVLTATTLGANIARVSAAPTLTLGANQNTLTVTVPKGGGTATTTTTLTSGTANAAGYTLTAALTEAEPGIAIKLKGGDVATSTALTAGAPALTLKTTSGATSNDTTVVTLDFTIDSTVTEGQKALKLAYVITDNGPSGPTLQSFTTSQCNALATYDGTNEEAVITLTDSRGDNQSYQVAKLADGHCWMLNNLKLGSASSSLTLTPTDTNIASNLTLPQLFNGSFTEEPDEATINHFYDDPVVFGSVPGDTGAGETNYGYLYNWSAATAGESRESMPGDGTHDNVAPYSICPANWRLPTASRIWDEDEEEYIYSGDYPDLDRAWGGTGTGSWSGEPNIAQWQYSGAFKGVLSGYWGGEYVGQGVLGFFWSASARPGYADPAFGAYFLADGVDPAGYGDRLMGVSVRCLLN
jgi:uncharacterized protein (TIGR02145 family)